MRAKSFRDGGNVKISAKLATITIVSVLAQLGLAVLGWGGIVPFFAEPARVALVIVTVVMAGVALFSAGNLSSGEHEDRGNRWVLMPFALIALLSAYLPAYTDRKDIWTIDGSAIRWLGVVLFTVGCALRIGPVFVLGRRFSGLVAIQPGHALVTDSIYRVIRNPSYLGLLIVLLGWALVFRSGVGILLMLLTVPPLIARINAEEKLLRAHFGSEYDTYCSRTWRLIPKIY